MHSNANTRVGSAIAALCIALIHLQWPAPALAVPDQWVKGTGDSSNAPKPAEPPVASKEDQLKRQKSGDASGNTNNYVVELNKNVKTLGPESGLELVSYNPDTGDLSVVSTSKQPQVIQPGDVLVGWYMSLRDGTSLQLAVVITEVLQGNEGVLVARTRQANMKEVFFRLAAKGSVDIAKNSLPGTPAGRVPILRKYAGSQSSMVAVTPLLLKELMQSTSTLPTSNLQNGQQLSELNSPWQSVDLDGKKVLDHANGVNSNSDASGQLKSYFDMEITEGRADFESPSLDFDFDTDHFYIRARGGVFWQAACHTRASVKGSLGGNPNVCWDKVSSDKILDETEVIIPIGIPMLVKIRVKARSEVQLGDMTGRSPVPDGGYWLETQGGISSNAGFNVYAGWNDRDGFTSGSDGPPLTAQQYDPVPAGQEKGVYVNTNSSDASVEFTLRPELVPEVFWGALWSRVGIDSTVKWDCFESDTQRHHPIQWNHQGQTKIDIYAQLDYWFSQVETATTNLYDSGPVSWPGGYVSQPPNIFLAYKYWGSHIPTLPPGFQVEFDAYGDGSGLAATDTFDPDDTDGIGKKNFRHVFWDFDGDGHTDVDLALDGQTLGTPNRLFYSSPLNPVYAYEANGARDVSVTIWDDEGQTTQKKIHVVVGNPPNVVLSASVNSTPFTVPATVTFNADGSNDRNPMTDTFDPDDSGTGDQHFKKILWDFDGDGLAEVDTLAPPVNIPDGDWYMAPLVPVHVYTKPGTYKVTVWVTDMEGFESQASTTVTVGPIVATPLPDIRGPKPPD